MVILTRGPDHVYEYLNRAALANAPVPRSDWIGRTLRENRPELAAQGYDAMYDGVYRTGESFVAHEARVVVRASDGSRAEGIFRFSLTPWREDDGKVSGVLANAIDISDEVAARELQQELIRETEQLRAEAESQRLRLAQLIDVIPAGVVIYDRDGKVTSGNRARLQIIGEAGQATDVGSAVAQLRPTHEDGRPFAIDDLPIMRALRGETVRGERLRVRGRDGVEKVVLSSAAPLRDATGAIDSAVQFFQELDPPS